MPLILALDADTRNVGYAIGTETRYDWGGQVDFSRKGLIDTRCHCILLWAQALLEKLQPDYVAIEVPIVGRNSKTALQLARLGGYLEAAAILSGAKFLRVNPQTAKAALVRGNASKEEMIKAATLVARTADLPVVVGHHHADAIGVLVAAQGKLVQRRWEST